MSRTTYVILRENEDGSWDVFDEDPVEAASANGAIRKALANTPISKNGGVGRFNAVPTRSWRPEPVVIETTQRLRIG